MNPREHNNSRQALNELPISSVEELSRTFDKGFLPSGIAQPLLEYVKELREVSDIMGVGLRLSSRTLNTTTIRRITVSLLRGTWTEGPSLTTKRVHELHADFKQEIEQRNSEIRAEIELVQTYGASFGRVTAELYSQWLAEENPSLVAFLQL